MTPSHARPAVAIWLERAQALLLSLGSFYLLAIAQLSPHPLPGLRWLAFAVLFAGLTSAVRGTSFRRVALALCLVTVGLGGAAVIDIALTSAAHAHAHPHR